jgi:hypothetical protein
MPSDSKLPEAKENKIPVTLRITGYAFSRTAPRKSGPFGAAKATTYARKNIFGALKARSQGEHKKLQLIRRMFICKTCQIR